MLRERRNTSPSWVQLPLFTDEAVYLIAEALRAFEPGYGIPYLGVDLNDCLEERGAGERRRSGKVPIMPLVVYVAGIALATRERWGPLCAVSSRYKRAYGGCEWKGR